MNSNVFSDDTLGNASHRSAVFDATAFGFDPANTGAENRTALQMVIDTACAADGGVIKIPANGVYEIAGEVIVTPPASGTLTITSSGGQAKLAQTNETTSIFIVGPDDEPTKGGNIIMKNLWISGLLPPLEGTENDGIRVGSGQ